MGDDQDVIAVRHSVPFNAQAWQQLDRTLPELMDRYVIILIIRNAVLPIDHTITCT